MAYASIEQLMDRYGERLLVQLTDRATPPTGVIDPAVVDRALADTDAAIDSYLAGRYALPLGEAPPLLADLAQAIGIYKLHPFAPDPKIEQDYKDAFAALDRIAKGIQKLPVAGIEPVSSRAAGVEVIDRDRDMTPENLRGFI
ncbi:MAG: DUF1320 domain-containing protein [Novosphingobium sp.]|uniref:gp436 family protein n=1 Tax=Novosphingobium sp. TaxID=1874826 RepID=UPI0032B8FC52